MKKEMFQDKEPEEKILMLRDNCDKLENFTYEKAYTNQDIEVFCDKLSKIMIDVKQKEAELSRIKKEHAEKIKPLKAELSELLDCIKFRSKMVTEKVYIFVDHVDNLVGYYDSNGKLIYTRMLRIDEHQKSIMEVVRNEMNNDTDDDPDDNENTEDTEDAEYADYTEDDERN